MLARCFLAALLFGALAVPLLHQASAQPKTASVEYTRKEDVIYGRKDGLAMTMDVFTPKEKANGPSLGVPEVGPLSPQMVSLAIGAVLIVGVSWLVRK